MDRQVLIEGGFVPTRYDGDPGEYLTKSQAVETLPYTGTHAVDGDYIVEGMRAVTEVLPDGSVQLCIADADYVEGPYAAGSEEAIGLLKDALGLLPREGRQPL